MRQMLDGFCAGVKKIYDEARYSTGLIKIIVIEGLWLDFIIFTGPFLMERSPCWSRSRHFPAVFLVCFIVRRGLPKSVKAS